MAPECYNARGAMHGRSMIFLGVPLSVGGLGNFLVPPHIGPPDMAFPRLNLARYWSYFAGGVVLLASFAMPGGAAQSGWSSCAPLSAIATSGQIRRMRADDFNAWKRQQVAELQAGR